MISARNQGQSCPGVGQNWSGSIDADGMARFLRSIYPQKTAMHVAADTGLPVESIKNWLNGVSAPGFRATVTLALTYGPEFLTSMVKEKPRWLDRAAREHRQQELERKLESIKAELASL